MYTPHLKDVVEMGNTVTLKNTVGKELVFTLVSKYEADPTTGKISVASPLGQAMEGRKLKETFSVDLPAGTQEYSILKIE